MLMCICLRAGWDSNDELRMIWVETNVYDGISIKRNKRRETKGNACRCAVVCENLTIYDKNACAHIKSETLRCDW